MTALAQALYDREDQSGDPRGQAWSVHRNARAIVVTLNHWCVPHRDAAWEASMRATLAGGDAAFERQYRRNWGTPSGDAWYPEFAAQVREVKPWQFEGWYVREATGRLAGQPFLRSWDAGYHRPALTMGQYDQKTGTLWVMRELRVETMLIHDFRDLVRFLCGQATIEELAKENRKAALAWIEKERKERFYGWPMPWLNPGEQFVDFGAEHEMAYTSGLAASEETRTAALVLAQAGIRMRGQKAQWDDRDTILRFLLRESTTNRGNPWLLIDPSCRWLLKGMAGGLTKPTRMQRQAGPKRDRLYEDVHDTLSYMAAACWPLRRVQKMKDEAEKRAESEARTRAASDQKRAGYARPAPAPQDGNSWARVHSRWDN